MPEAKSKAAERAAEMAAFKGKVETVLERARAAAMSAYEAFAKTAPRTEHGLIADACGRASVVVYKPSRRLLQVLKELDEIRSGHNGAWSVSDFTRGIRSQSVKGHEAACRAAREVLVGDLSGEGEFFAKSYID